jgi:hypothetical protein
MVAHSLQYWLVLVVVLALEDEFVVQFEMHNEWSRHDHG